MLKSSTFNSITNEIDATNASRTDPTCPDTLNCIPVPKDVKLETATTKPRIDSARNNNQINVIYSSNAQEFGSGEDNCMDIATGSSLSALQLSASLLRITESPLAHARSHLKELIAKQNKIYIDLSKEKFKLDCSELAKLNEMMNNVKFYKEKLYKIKKQMQNIYQRTKDLKKRAANIEACKQREYQRKVDKQQQEESLIAKQQT